MSIRVVIGSSNEKISKQLSRFLTENGMHVLSDTVDGYDMLRKVHTMYPDLVIVDDRMKGMMGSEIAEIIITEKVCPVLALVRGSELSYYVNLNQDPLFCSITKPVGRDLLLGNINLLHKTSKSILQLEKKVGKMTKQEDDQKIIEEAKQVLMENMNLTEHEAHRRIQKQSMDKGLPKVKIAQTIIRMFK